MGTLLDDSHADSIQERENEDWLVIVTSDYNRIPKLTSHTSDPATSLMVIMNQSVEPSEV